MDKNTELEMLATQRNEITEHIIYQRFSQMAKDPHNKEILLRLSEGELQHHNWWKQHTQREVEPHKMRVRLYCLISRIMGITFGLKLMENNHRQLKVATQRKISPQSPIPSRSAGEDERETQLLGLLDEERLNYISAVVLGLNDALVELTGALAGFTFAMQSARLVATAGLITGVAAALSMGGTGYQTKKSEESLHTPLKFALYTGITYIVTVVLLILPYFIFGNVYFSLGVTLAVAIAIILVFNFYISVAKGVSFWGKFKEMASLSLGIAGISFGIGYLVREFLGLEI